MARVQMTLASVANDVSQFLSQVGATSQNTGAQMMGNLIGLLAQRTEQPSSESGHGEAGAAAPDKTGPAIAAGLQGLGQALGSIPGGGKTTPPAKTPEAKNPASDPSGTSGKDPAAPKIGAAPAAAGAAKAAVAKAAKAGLAAGASLNRTLGAKVPAKSVSAAKTSPNKAPAVTPETKATPAPTSSAPVSSAPVSDATPPEAPMSLPATTAPEPMCSAPAAPAAPAASS